MSKRSDRQKYAACMMVIRHRLEVIDRFLARANTTGYEVPDAETVCLQFRKVFEGIAMSSLCANREKCEEARKSFMKQWHADEILRFVDALNPHFYPVPIWRKFSSDGLGGIVGHVEGGFLTRDELSEAYGRCGDLLHTENPYRPTRIDLSEWHPRFRLWRDRTMTLLRLHTTQLVDEKIQWWVVMRFGTNQPVQVAEFERLK